MSEKIVFEKKKSLGQHFLTSDIVPKWMCDAASLKSGEMVLEVGPGTGVLTKELLKRGVNAIALEADSRAIDVLKKTFENEISSGRLTIHHIDVRSFEIKDLNLRDQEFKVVSNIPYYLSGMLFRTFLENPIQPSDLVFLVQKEVAERIARSKKESILSISVKVFGIPKFVRTVSRGHFTPAPKVDSAIISVENISRKNFEKISPDHFFEALHLSFGQKRKQLLGNFAKKYDRNSLINIFSTLDIKTDARAEDIPLQKWLNLSRELEKISNT